MGRGNVHSQRLKLARARKKKTVKPGLEVLTIEELLARAQENIDCFKYDIAQKYCQEALQKDPDHIPALETSSSLCLETGNLDGARHCLGRAITLQPDEGYAKYLSMAQLMEGNASLQCYQKGIEILSEELADILVSENDKENMPLDPTTENGATEVENMDGNATAEVNGVSNPSESENIAEENGIDGVTSDEDILPSSSSEKSRDKDVLIRKISTAFCSIAELYMTDLCDEEEAEKQCLSHIQKAIEADPSNPEAFQHMASFQLVKQEQEEAMTYIMKSVDLWLPKYKEISEGKAAAGTFDPVEVCPLSYPTRLSAAKILIEVAKYDTAVQVLEGLSEEDDEIVDTWYLLGWTHHLQGEEHKESARHYFHRAKQVHAIAPSEDTQLVEHLEELVEELGPLTEEELKELEATEQEVEEALQKDSDDEDTEMDTS